MVLSGTSLSRNAGGKRRNDCPDTASTIMISASWSVMVSFDVLVSVSCMIILQRGLLPGMKSFHTSVSPWRMSMMRSIDLVPKTEQALASKASAALGKMKLLRSNRDRKAFDIGSISIRCLKRNADKHSWMLCNVKRGKSKWHNDWNVFCLLRQQSCG